jgi:putative transposase
MEVATRRVICVGITSHSNAAWVLQVGRNLTDAFTGFLRGKDLLIVDRDSSFRAAFRSLLEQAGIRPLRTPPSSPNCYAYIERFPGTFKGRSLKG